MGLRATEFTEGVIGLKGVHDQLLGLGRLPKQTPKPESQTRFRFRFRV